MALEKNLVVSDPYSLNPDPDPGFFSVKEIESLYFYKTLNIYSSACKNLNGTPKLEENPSAPESLHFITFFDFCLDPYAKR